MRGASDVAFKDRYTAWLTLRLETLRADAESEAFPDLLRRMDDAARATMATAASKPWMVWAKLEIFERALCGEGTPRSDDPVWILAALKADLLMNGLEWEQPQ